MPIGIGGKGLFLKLSSIQAKDASRTTWEEKTTSCYQPSSQETEHCAADSKQLYIVHKRRPCRVSVPLFTAVHRQIFSVTVNV